MLKTLNYDINDEAVFWVTVEEFIKNFSYIGVSKVHSNY